jgi:hypothetical protein
MSPVLCGFLVKVGGVLREKVSWVLAKDIQFVVAMVGRERVVTGICCNGTCLLILVCWYAMKRMKMKIITMINRINRGNSF